MKIPAVGWGSKVKVLSVVGGGEMDIFWNYTFGNVDFLGQVEN